MLTRPPLIIFAPYTFPMTNLNRPVLNKLKVLLGLLLLAGVVQAQENLYGPDAALDVAYVRAVHAAPDAGAVEVASNDVVLGQLEFTQVTPYTPLEPGTTSLSAGELSADVTLEAGEFYTAVVLLGEATLLTDEPLVDASRGLLTLYNLSSSDAVRLATADGETEIIGEVAPLTGNSTVVNQAEVALGVFAGEEQLGALEPRLLERGVAHGVFLFDGAEGPVVTYTAAESAD